MTSLRSRTLEILPGAIVHLAALVVAGSVLIAAGQPLFAEDTWWHLSMGRAYANEGPWLARDPLLHTAAGPPAPAAWLADLVFVAIEAALGLEGLRVANALGAALLLGLAWWLLRRASGSSAFASLGVIFFCTLSAYRLFQLRPHLFSMLAALLLVCLLVIDGRSPSWRRVLCSAALLGAWANAHAGFVLGLALIAAAIAGIACASPWRRQQRERDRARALRLGVALGAGLLATLANPLGAKQYLPYFVAGEETPSLGWVADEWGRVDLFSVPSANLPPSLLTWMLVWCLIVSLACIAYLALQRRQTGLSAPKNDGGAVNPALLGLAALGLLALLYAVRFLWLGILPLLLIGQAASALAGLRTPSRNAFAWAAAVLGILLVPGFVAWGPWPMISKGIHRQAYHDPYLPSKFNAHPVWLLRDAQLEGRLYNSYRDGNFLGYWLAPRMRVFINGSLNVPLDVMRASQAIESRAALANESFLELLDRYEIDVFVGTGVPQVPPPGRPRVSTTNHLERSPGWIPIFRSLQSAVYLRDNDRNRDNLDRVVVHYEDRGVPFDRERGFDVARVSREAPGWAHRHGLIPRDYPHLPAAVHAGDPQRRRLARERLASLQAVLGLYEQALALDLRRLQTQPDAVSATRRVVWSLLRLRRWDEAARAATRLAELAPADDGLSRLLIDAARATPALPDSQAVEYVAQLPLLSRPEARRLGAGYQPPEVRRP